MLFMIFRENVKAGNLMPHSDFTQLQNYLFNARENFMDRKKDGKMRGLFKGIFS